MNKNYILNYFNSKNISIIKPIKYGTAGFRTIYNNNFLYICELAFIFICKLSSNTKSTFGIMITASHNSEKYNGLKIANHNGELLEKKIEEQLEQFVNLDKKSLNYCLKYTLPIHNSSVILGYDPRSSSTIIVNHLHSFAQLFNTTIINLGVCTTPRLFRAVLELNNGNVDFLKPYSLELLKIMHNPLQNITKQIEKNNWKIYIDHANGSAKVIFSEKFIKKFEKHFNCTITIATPDGKINENCGSDYITSGNGIPKFMTEILNNNENYIGVSFDGDCDRIVFYDNDKIYDGDYISILLLLLVDSILEESSNEISKAIIVTPYSNFNIKTIVENKKWNFVSTAPGVKNLHAEAVKYDISIYFEKNGHGNMHFSDKLLKNQRFEYLHKMLYSKAGDSAAIFILVIYALHYLNMSWNDLWDFIPNTVQLNTSVHRNNMKLQLKANDLETEIISPPNISTELNHINRKYKQNRTVIRPSGTEPIIRILVEGSDQIMVQEHSSELLAFLKKHV